MTPDERAEWLAWRRHGLGASDIAAILGLSPWASPFSVWADKLGYLPADDGGIDDDDPRVFGQRAEAMIAPWFADRTGHEVRDTQRRYTHPRVDWARATPDGAVHSTGGDRLGGLEIKTDYQGKEWDTIPVHYQAQAQWQMYVTGWPKVWFAVLHNRRFRIYVLERDEADIKTMVDAATAFWEDHIQLGVAPSLDGSSATLDALAAAFPDAAKETTTDVSGVLDAFDMLRDAKARAKAANADADHASAVIRWAMRDAEIGVAGDDEVCKLATQTRRTTCPSCTETTSETTYRVLRPSKGYK